MKTPTGSHSDIWRSRRKCSHNRRPMRSRTGIGRPSARIQTASKFLDLLISKKFAEPHDSLSMNQNLLATYQCGFRFCGERVKLPKVQSSDGNWPWNWLPSQCDLRRHLRALRI